MLNNPSFRTLLQFLSGVNWTVWQNQFGRNSSDGFGCYDKMWFATNKAIFYTFI